MSALFAFSGTPNLMCTSLVGTTAWGNRTLAGWVFVTSLTNLNECIEADATTGGFMFIGGGAGNSTTAGNISFRLTNATGSSNSDIFATCSQSAWHHCAMTWDGTTQRTYVDGVATGTATPAGFTSTGNWSVTEIGPCDGTIDNVVFYAAALSAAEISDLYAKRRPTRFTNIMAWYPLFPGNTTAMLADFSGKGNTLVKTGTVNDGTTAAPAGWGSPITLPFRAQASAIALAGTAANTSAAAGTISSAQALAGTAAATSSATGAIALAVPITGVTSANPSAATGTLFIAGASGTAAAKSAATGTVFIGGAGGTAAAISAAAAVALVAQAIVGAAAAASAATGTLFIAGAGGTAAATTSATGAASVSQALSDTSAATTAATAAMLVARAEVGTSANSSSATGALSVAQDIAGTSAAKSAADSSFGLGGNAANATASTAPMSVAQALSSTVANSTATTAPIVVAQALVATPANTTAASGTLFVSVPFVGSAPVATAATAPMSVAVPVSGITSPASTAALGNFGIAEALQDVSVSSTAATASMLLDRAEIGAAPVATSATAAASVAQALTDTSVVTTAATGAILVARVSSGLASGASAATGGITVFTGAMAGAPAVATAAIGALNLARPFSSTTSLSAVSATGGITIGRTLTAASYTAYAAMQRVHAPRIVGDTRSFTIRVFDDAENPIDFSGTFATIKLVKYDLTAVIVNEAPCDIEINKISYRPSALDVAVAGNYLWRISIATSDGVLVLGHYFSELLADI